jgi:hypothetical protein
MAENGGFNVDFPVAGEITDATAGIIGTICLKRY